MLLIRLLKESSILAIQALITNKLRTILSLLGITIGIFAIITVFTAVDSLEMNVRSSVESLGEDVVFIQKWPWLTEGEYKWWEFYKRPQPQLKELAEIKKRCNLAEACVFSVSGNTTVKYRSNSIENVNITSVSHEYDQIVSFQLETGRYFSENESISGKNLAIIGKNIALGLYGHNRAVGKSIKIKGANYKIIGVFKKEGESIIGESHDNQVILTVNSVRKLIAIYKRHIEARIMVKAKKGVANTELKDNLTGILRSIRKLKPMAEDNFALNETSILSNGLDQMFGIINLAGWIIGGFSILVGGFGIANIMFVSVKERTSIIGIQKAIGAKSYFILLQFLFESIILSLIGGITGLFFVYVCSHIASSFIEMEFSLTNSNIILGILVSALIGIISGFVPAYSASKLDPVAAIRAN